jgi:phosphoribosylanthranilate isomerase
MQKKLKIKVCGLTSPGNRAEAEAAGAGLLGFIFYPKSQRYVGNLPEKELAELLDSGKPKVGVFVNETAGKIIHLCKTYRLYFAQLHGDETPGFCQKLKDGGVKIIKVFRVGESVNFEACKDYEGIADYFLFDTKAREYGGTGKKFDWKILEKYEGETPFFLSGGIKPGDAASIGQIAHPRFFGVDLNSGFEERPGIKNNELLKIFIRQLYELPGK